jgi:hypothetical protein
MKDKDWITRFSKTHEKSWGEMDISKLHGVNL